MPNPFTILLVDDDSHVADILNRAAGRTFPEAVFVHATGFAQAASYVEDLTGLGPQLILLDVDLQVGLSGLDFLSLLRQHPQGRLLPVVMLSARDEFSQVQEAYFRGASAFTRKPFDYGGWKAYVQRLRSYWYETATVPRLWFRKQASQ